MVEGHMISTVNVNKYRMQKQLPPNHQSQADIHRKSTPSEEVLSSESDVEEYLNEDNK